VSRPNPHPTFEEVREWSIERATSWALDDAGRDRLALDEIDPAQALRVEAFNLLLPMAASAIGVSSDFGSSGWRGDLKRRGLDRLARAVALHALGIRSTRPPAGRLDVVGVGEVATPSMLDPMIHVLRALPAERRLAVAGDPGVYRRFARTALEPIPATIPWREERRILGRATREARGRWAELSSQPPAFTLRGTDLTGQALERLRPLVLRSLPWIAVEHEAIRRVIERSGPRWVVLASDQHRIGRIAVGVARAAGCKTMVLQHGVPQYSLGYLPVVADTIAIWSDAAHDWFVSGGADPRRIRRLGNPRMDQLVARDRTRDREEVAQRLGLPGGPRLLVGLSPSDSDRNLALLRLGLATLKNNSTATMIVKLHPGGGRWDDVRSVVEDSEARVRDRIRIARLDALYPLLMWADLTLIHRSTVALESLAAGTPVAIIGGAGDSPTDSLPANLDLPEVTDPGTLQSLLDRIGTDDARLQFIAERKDAIERSTGPLDGQTVKRIADVLLEESVES
jgi:hypothetical protein